MHELVITGGTIVDGTGAPAVEGDVVVADGTIVEVGPTGSVTVPVGAEVIDARGLLVTPGWVDIHTHYDGQVTWDPYLTPSSWHGVTTVVTGNCGVGFAPCHPSERQWLVELMEGVEDIPGTALAEGMRWGWETFPEYLDFIEAMPRIMDVGTQIAHGPVRAYVMGERGARNEPATPEDIARMAAIVKEAVAAGALGFSTSRTMLHKALDGEPVPGTFATEDELFGIGMALAELGTGLFEVSPTGVAGEDDLAPPREMAWMRRLSATIGRPVTFGMTQSNTAPHLYREMLAEAEAAAADGAQVFMQVAGRASGLLFGLETTYHPFKGRPTWDALEPLPREERVARLRDPEIRARVLAEGTDTPSLLTTMGSRIWAFGDTVDYEPPASESLAEVAARTGVTPAELLYEWQLRDDGRQMFNVPILNYAEASFEPLREMLSHPNAVLGLGDGGAHVAIICDASISTTMLTHWTRDRTRGPKLPLELAVRRQTGDTARLYGLLDRGRIAAGYRADLNVIDYDRLRVHVPTVAHDLPGGAPRIVQKADGYVATVVAGQVVARDGEPTGALPGRVVRGARPAPA